MKVGLLKLLLLNIFIIGYSQVWQYKRANDPAIQYAGRIDFSDPLFPQFSFPGVSISARFSGTQLRAVLKEFGTGGPQTTNYFTVIIDGSIFKTFALTTTDTLYDLATGLVNQEHLVTLFKRTESSVGRVGFKGFLIPTSNLIPFDFNKNRKIEFIGDSWTCGYGNEIATNNPNTGFHSVNEDHYAAWGPIAARRLGATHVSTAISGRGLYRNNTGSTFNTIPQEYGRLYPGQNAPAWDPNRFVPDVVVIHLGTNDFYQESASPSLPLDSAAYVNAYLAFLQTIRGNYPSAKLVLAFGNSISDWYPVGLKQLTRWRNYIQATVNRFKAISDANIFSIELSVQSAPYGEDWHPSKATHLQMANELTPFLQNLMGWTNGTVDCNGVLNGSAHLDPCNRCVDGTTGLESCLTLAFKEEKEIEMISGIQISSQHISLQQYADTPWEITDIHGRVVLQGNHTLIDLEILPHHGVYILLVKQKSEQKRISFLKL
ncbi:MAG: GDSL-type esterase/lipase family protein [Cytophagaceae bacterium]|nr:GDSL-type esterase/lipase family protein [Cytophagaceae bacterium]